MALRAGQARVQTCLRELSPSPQKQHAHRFKETWAAKREADAQRMRALQQEAEAREQAAKAAAAAAAAATAGAAGGGGEGGAAGSADAAAASAPSSASQPSLLKRSFIPSAPASASPGFKAASVLEPMGCSSSSSSSSGEAVRCLEWWLQWGWVQGSGGECSNTHVVSRGGGGASCRGSAGGGEGCARSSCEGGECGVGDRGGGPECGQQQEQQQLKGQQQQEQQGQQGWQQQFRQQ